jgi:hypothetical protein
MARNEARKALVKLKQDIGFGYIVSGFLFLLSASRHWFVMTASDSLWGSLLVVSVIGLLSTLIVPSIWGGPAWLFRKLAGGIGHTVFSLLLSILYLGFFWPAGLIMRLRKGSHPIYAWTSEPPKGMEGWTRKRVETIGDKDTRGEKVRHLALQPFFVLSFFIQRGHYLLVPVLVLLMALGLLLFFIQTSPVAPMIYTLF